jgi:hypothetical protein
MDQHRVLAGMWGPPVEGQSWGQLNLSFDNQPLPLDKAV